MTNELIKTEELIAGVVVILAILFGLYYNANHTPNYSVHTAAIKIAIIDTGYQGNEGLKVCPTGSLDFNTGLKEVGISPLNKDHGTKVASIIAESLKNVDYCALIYQVESIKGINPLHIALAATLAEDENVVAINISLTGPLTDDAENVALLNVSQKAKLFMAAGNQKQDLTKKCLAFPACYGIANAQVVGALTPAGYLRAEYSNFGRGIVNNWQSGEVKWRGTLDYGTSFAAPRALSKYVLSLVSLQQAKQH